MPVKYEAKSEYQRRFEDLADPSNPPLPDFYQRPSEGPLAVPSNTGMTHEPPMQHKKAVHSSVSQQNSYVSLEPPIQRKKKPIVPHGSQQPPAESHQNGQAARKDQEYVLLGSQEKFTPNIIYKAKPVVEHRPQENGDSDPPTNTPLAPRPDLPPPPKVNVDTGAPKRQTKKVDMSKMANGNVKESEAIKRPSKPHTTHPKQLANGPSPPKSSEEPRRGRSREKDRPAKKVSVDLKHADKADVQTDDAASDYALKYKVGISPPRTRGPKRLSEYQMQFAWKKGVGASPLLDAEQVVYKSSTQLVPQRAEFSKTSEYRKQFQSWDVPAAAQESNNVPEGGSNKAKIRRSKSVDGPRPDRLAAAGNERVTSNHDPRLVQESLNPLRLHFPHGPQKKERSEYAANFASPEIFSYDQGVWKGANPPQVQSNKDDAKTGAAPLSWFAEVVELRQKAEEYRKRARGTHFSKQHVAQLLAQQNELWDTASTSSVLSALSLERPGSDRPSPAVKAKKSSTSLLPDQPPAGRKTVWGHDRDPVDSVREGSVASTARSVSVADSQEIFSNVSEPSTLVEEYANGDDLPSSNGRIPTPKMLDGKRHHLDRTTPLVGGALLTSPNSDKAAKSKGKRRANSQSSVASTLSVPASVAVEPPTDRAGAEASDVQTSRSVDALARPTYGKPTRDSHLLIDDDASTDRPMNTKFVHSPPQENKAIRHNRGKFPDVDIPSTINEDSGATYKANNTKKSSTKKFNPANHEVKLSDIPPRPDFEDDVLSMSARSVASSCSMASEVLERARHRRDDFWGQKRGVPGKV